MSVPAQPVTVIIPVWDRYTEFLPDAVESVRRNAPEPPIVIVDNASSTDVSRAPGLHGGAGAPAAHRWWGAKPWFGAGRHGVRRLSGRRRHAAFEGTFDFFAGGSPTTPLWPSARPRSSTAKPASGTVTRAVSCRRSPAGGGYFTFGNTLWSLFPLQGCAILRTAQVREAGGYADADWGEDWVLAVSLAFRGHVEVNERLGLVYRPTEGSLWRRPRARGELTASARRVRERMRSDSAVPGWARGLLPAIAVLQLAVIYVPARSTWPRAGSRPLVVESV